MVASALHGFMKYHTPFRYLTDHLPPPSTVPLKVKMTVPEKDFNTEVVLKPEDDMDTITKLLRAQMEKQSLVIVEFPKCEEFEIAIIRYTLFNILFLDRVVFTFNHVQ